MTRDEILKMEAGREMDALIEKLLYPEQTITVDKNAAYQKTPQGYIGLHIIAPYSRSISNAWEVVEKLQKEYEFILTFKDNEWKAIFYSFGIDTQVIAETALLAICRAALLAAMETE
jgi:hypothetical protein